MSEWEWSRKNEEIGGIIWIGGDTSLRGPFCVASSLRTRALFHMPHDGYTLKNNQNGGRTENGIGTVANDPTYNINRYHNRPKGGVGKN